jgi:hypothetical protein
MLCAKNGETMPLFKISAVTRSGTILATLTADSAAEALAKLRHTHHSGTRAWVTDEEGNDVSEGDLERRVAVEGGNA